MINIEESKDGRVLEIHISGKVRKDDYKHLVPEADRMIRERGKINLILDMVDFRGWDAGAMWEDLKFDLKHYTDFERVAMVGEKRWQKGMSKFCRPFTTAKVKYFDRSRLNEAREWAAAN